MSTSKSGSMNSLMASLSTSFGKVPPVAVPAMLDCILASTGLPPSSLFASLLDAFPNLIKDILEEDEKLGRDRCKYLTSLVGALCHLLKKLGANNNALQSFMSRSFIPLLKLVHASDRELLNQIGELFINVVIETNSWVVVEENLVPFFVRFVGLSTGMPQHKESDAFECAVFKGLNDLRNVVGVVKEHMLSPSGPFPLPISCHILTLMLDASLHSLQSASISELIVANDYYAEKFAANLIWDLCNLTERLLLQSLEHRSCTIHFFLPIIFKAFVSYRSFEISVHGQKQILLRKSFLEKIWKCCRTLFSLGPLERRDAYNVLSMYFSSLPCTEQCDVADTSMSEEEFDIRSEKEFWDEIKRGLVDKEGLVRKQSLQMLKNVLPINGGSQPSSGVSDTKLCERSIPRGMTKRELWADKEAKSMGIGKINKSADQNLNSHQQWEAFILLYEMLEEYGTHLVEAAWNHQVSLLLQFSMSHVNFASLVDGIHRNQCEIVGEIFNWLSILWERGFCHDNPQVRCLIMQSFLGIEWKNYGNSAKSVPETFVLGPFIQALNDPVHHKEFGVKGVYSSRIIEGAAQFFHQYTSCLNERNRIAFLSKLASAAKQQSFSRAGLMGLAECIALAACRNDSEADWCEDAFLDMANVEISSENFLQHDKATLLDILRFVIESSRQHFNPNYRFRVCDKVLEAAASVVCVFEVPLEILLHFISTLPRELTDYGGSLRVKVQEWLSGCGKKHCSSRCYNTDVKLLKSLHEFPKKFTSCHCLVDDFLIYDDEDLDAWEFEIKRWARVLFLAIKEEHHLMPILEVDRDGRYVILTEKGWKGIKKMNLSLGTVRWFFNALEVCLKKEGKGFYSAYRDGDRGYIAQRCSNSRGEYMALVEYCGGGRRNCVFIPGDKDRVGWRKLAMALKEAGSGGGCQLPPITTVQNSNLRSYSDVLQGSREVEKFRDVNYAEKVGLVKKGPVTSAGNDLLRDGVGRDVVALKEENLLKALSDMEEQLGELTNKVGWLKRCVELKGISGLGLDHGRDIEDQWAKENIDIQSDPRGSWRSIGGWNCAAAFGVATDNLVEGGSPYGGGSGTGKGFENRTERCDGGKRFYDVVSGA
ncbi:hypothetical protein F2P56_004263 [Juglans regia]|uniref:Uncharacterized protein n=1 Tax=Juglans regia TaxID=51240 RepID=A0A833Y4V9_JUGRE|nr:hypothetical protein F2P56_004263 [Juglans regia]